MQENRIEKAEILDLIWKHYKREHIGLEFGQKRIRF